MTGPWRGGAAAQEQPGRVGEGSAPAAGASAAAGADGRGARAPSARERSARRAAGVHRRGLEDHVRRRLEGPPRQRRLCPAGVSKVTERDFPWWAGRVQARRVWARRTHAPRPRLRGTSRRGARTGPRTRSHRPAARGKWHVWRVPGRTHMQTRSKQLLSRTNPKFPRPQLRPAGHAPQGPGEPGVRSQQFRENAVIQQLSRSVWKTVQWRGQRLPLAV